MFIAFFAWSLCARLSLAQDVSLPEPICKTFQFFSGPHAVPKHLWTNSPPGGSEFGHVFKTNEQLLKKISRVRGHREFPAAWSSGLEKNSSLKSLLADDLKKNEWLQCLSFYIDQDTDRDGIPDWSALTNGTPAFILEPLDLDIDGDGVENVLDPEPFNRKIKRSVGQSEVPPHLLAQAADTRLLQKQLFQEFGIIAVELTDQHSTFVLQNFLYLLRNGLKKSTIRSLKSLKVIYAFAGHDDAMDIAAYHPGSQAVSVGGDSAYPSTPLVSPIDFEPKISLLASLAHEIGHAYLLERVTAKELLRMSHKMGNWQRGPASVQPPAQPLSRPVL
ncbi:MAG: hypothetical protein EOP04_23670, partial [Proteobacteria bacterium]